MRSRDFTNAARRFLFVAVAGWAASGCSEDGTRLVVPDVPEPVIDFTDAALLVAAHAEYLTAMDFDRYAALLETPTPGRSEGFQYFPQNEDLTDFPWIVGDSWGYETELNMIGNMMDPTFVSEVTGNSVDTIEMDLVILNQEDVADECVELECSAVILILWAANTGASSDVRFRILMCPDADGFLRIRQIEELPPFLPVPRVTDTSVESASWARIKSIYRL